MALVALVLVVLVGGAVAVGVSAPRATRATVPRGATTTRATNRPVRTFNILDAADLPHAWTLPGPAWVPVARPTDGAGFSGALLLPSIAIDQALRSGYRIFPALAAGTNRSGATSPNAPRDTWERGDAAVAMQTASVLFALGEDSRSGPLHDALMVGAASLDATAVAVLGAEGSNPGPNADFFNRLRKRNAAYDARMRKLNREGFEQFENGNWIGFAGKLFEAGGALLEGAYRGVRDVFKGSHGGPPAINLRLGWTPREADDYAHRAFLAARRA